MSIPVSAHQAEAFAAKLEAAVDLHITAVGYFDNGSGHWCIEAYFTEPPDPVILTRILQDELGPDATLPGPLVQELADRNWVAMAQRGLAPVSAGRFCVHGSHDRARVAGSPFPIEIDAGEAFGTAHHGTTQGCLLALDRLLKRRRFRNVADIGTGSGVLAIATAKALRTSKIVASDIDPVAIRVTQENIRKNGVRANVDALCGSGFRHPHLRRKASFDLIFANILAGPLKALAGDISRALAPGGQAILSGLMNEQARMVENHYRSHELRFERRIRIDGWTTLILSKGSNLKKKNRRDGSS